MTLFAQFVAAYPGVQATRVYSDSQGVMDAVIAGETDLTEIYWTVPAYYNGRARQEHMELGCSVLGTESVFFVKNGSANGGPLAGWAIAIIAVVSALAVLLCASLAFVVQKERDGHPIFHAFVDKHAQSVEVTPGSAGGGRA